MNPLTAMKLHAGRPPDLVDLEVLLRAAAVTTRREAERLHELTYGTDPMSAEADVSSSTATSAGRLTGIPDRRDEQRRRPPRRAGYTRTSAGEPSNARPYFVRSRHAWPKAGSAATST